MDMSLNKLWDIVKDRESMGLQRVSYHLVTKQQGINLEYHMAFIRMFLIGTIINIINQLVTPWSIPKCGFLKHLRSSISGARKSG